MNCCKNRPLSFALWVILITMTLAAVSPSISALLSTEASQSFTIEICDPTGKVKAMTFDGTSSSQDSSLHDTDIHCLLCILSEFQAAIVTLACILLLGFIVRQTLTLVYHEWRLVIRTLRWRPNRSQAPPLSPLFS